MREYKISINELKEFQDLITKGYKVYEVNIHRGIAEIKLKFEDSVEIGTIILVNDNLRKRGIYYEMYNYENTTRI